MWYLRKKPSYLSFSADRMQYPSHGARRKVTAMAVKNAEEALARHLANASSQKRLLGELAVALGLPQPPERIEIYDNSHIQGKHAVGGMVVAGPEGLQKAAYRRDDATSSPIKPPPTITALSMLRAVFLSFNASCVSLNT